MKKTLLSLTAFLLAFLFAGVAHAAEAGDPVASQALTYVIEVASALLLVLLAWASAKASAWMKAKTGIEVNAMLSSFAMQGIAFAEEKAHQAVKANGEKLRGPEKLELALQFAIDLAEANGLPKKAQEKLSDYIEARLGLDRPSE